MRDDLKFLYSPKYLLWQFRSKSSETQVRGLGLNWGKRHSRLSTDLGREGGRQIITGTDLLSRSD